MPESGGITIVKRFIYRDADEEWSNKYLFTGTKPTASGTWKTLADAIIDQEKLLVSQRTKFIRAYGYAPGADVSEWQHDYLGPPDTSITGVPAWSAANAPQGDGAAVVRWFTGRYSSRGKKIYCRKFFHDIPTSTTDPDEVNPTVLGYLNTYAAYMISGSLPGSVKVSDKEGSTLTDGRGMPYMTTRTLKRRGKRPPS